MWRPSVRPGAGAPEEEPRRARTVWRVATPLALGVCGALVVTSAANSDGTDLRPGRYNDLGSVVRSENREVQQLQDRASELTAEVEELGRRGGDQTTREVRDDSQGARDMAGLEEMTGPGLTITLSDAPLEVVEASDLNPNRLVVHQQDIQAVVNALWRGGADAVTLQGRRITTTTGIKCAGSTVQLQGLVFPEPYVVSAVGLPDELLASVLDDDYVGLFREDALTPEIDVGFDVEVADTMTAPAYDGLLDITYAQPAG